MLGEKASEACYLLLQVSYFVDKEVELQKYEIEC
jgi:hypothetical protein